MKRLKYNLKLLFLVSILGCFLLSGCGNSKSSNNGESLVNVSGYYLTYNGSIELESLSVKQDDPEDILAIYQETGNPTYRDSLLIAERYSQGLGINAFAQNNLDALIDNGLTLADVKKTQISIKKDGKKENAVLVEYKITNGFISSIPTLYVSQLFIPNDNSVVLMSFISDEAGASKSASDMFKNIK